MPEIKINVKGVFETKGGRVSGFGGGGGGRGGGSDPQEGGGEDAEGGFFTKLNKMFTQPLYDLLRVMGVSFRSIAAVRLVAGQGAKAEKGEAGEGLGGLMGSLGAGAAGGLAVAGAGLIVKKVTDKIEEIKQILMENSEVLKAIVHVNESMLGGVSDAVLMTALYIYDILSETEILVEQTKKVYATAVMVKNHILGQIADARRLYEWVTGIAGRLLNRFVEQITTVATELPKIPAKMVTGLINLGKFITAELLLLKTRVTNKIGSAIDYLKDLPENIGKKIISGFNTVMDVTGIGKAFDKGKAVFEAISGWEFPGINDLKDMTFGKLEKLTDIDFSDFTSLFDIDFSGFKKVFDLDFSGFTDLIDLDFTSAINFIETLTGGITGGGGGGGGGVGSVLSSLVSDVLE